MRKVKTLHIKEDQSMKKLKHIFHKVLEQIELRVCVLSFWVLTIRRDYVICLGLNSVTESSVMSDAHVTWKGKHISQLLLTERMLCACFSYFEEFLGVLFCKIASTNYCCWNCNAYNFNICQEIYPVVKVSLFP